MSENIIGINTYTNSINFGIFFVYSYRLTLAEVISDVAGSGEFVFSESRLPSSLRGEYASWGKRATACSERKIEKAATTTSNSDE